MANYNRIIMIGNLTRDPEHRLLPSGQSICRLALASNRQFKNRQTGDMVQEVCYVDIDVWGSQADSCKQYLQKGRAVLVEGRLKFDMWQDQNGQNRSKHIIVADRVVFLSQGLSAETSGSLDTQINSSDKQSDADQQLEKELLDQIDQIKERTAKEEENKDAAAEKKTVKPATASTKSKKSGLAKEAVKAGTSEAESYASDQVDGVEFQDEPPFKDELPF